MNLVSNIPVLVIIIPLFSAILIPVFGRISRSFGWYISLFATFFSFIISISLLNTVLTTGKISYRLGGWEPPWGIEYLVDYLNGYVLVVVGLIAFIVTVFAKKSVEKEIDADKITPFYSVYMLFITGLMGIIITGDIFNLYVFIEIASLSSYALVAMGRKRAALMASYNYLILGTIAATFILLGIGYLYMVTGTLNMADLSRRLPALYNSKVVLTAFAFFTVGISLKLALFPLHIWMPNAYTFSPSVVSAIMASTATKYGAYILIRIMFSVFTLDFDIRVIPFNEILVFLSSVAIIAGSVIALAQTNLRRMLAYSSVGQIGYIVLGAAIANQLAMTGGLIHILNHALMKGTLFLVAGSILYMTGIEEISDLNGMGRKMPLTMAAFTIGALSMIGFPLTVGFVSKWYLALGALDAGMWPLVLVIIISSLLTAVYFGRIIERIYFRDSIGAGEDSNQIIGQSGQSEAPMSMVLPTLILAGLCIVFGIAAFFPVSIAAKAANMLLGGG